MFSIRNWWSSGPVIPGAPALPETKYSMKGYAIIQASLEDILTKKAALKQCIPRPPPPPLPEVKFTKRGNKICNVTEEELQNVRASLRTYVKPPPPPPLPDKYSKIGFRLVDLSASVICEKLWTLRKVGLPDDKDYTSTSYESDVPLIVEFKSAVAQGVDKYFESLRVSGKRLIRSNDTVEEPDQERTFSSTNQWYLDLDLPDVDREILEDTPDNFVTDDKCSQWGCCGVRTRSTDVISDDSFSDDSFTDEECSEYMNVDTEPMELSESMQEELESSCMTVEVTSQPSWEPWTSFYSEDYSNTVVSEDEGDEMESGEH